MYHILTRLIDNEIIIWKHKRKGISQVKLGLQVPKNVDQDYKFVTTMVGDPQCTISAFIVCVDKTFRYTMDEYIIK